MHNLQSHSPRVPWPYPHLQTTVTMHRPRAYHYAEETPRPRIFPMVDMSHWSPNTDLGVSLQRAIYISLSICQPVLAPVSLSPSLSLPLPLWGCQSLFQALSLSLCLYLVFPLFDFCRSFSAFLSVSSSLPQAGVFSHSLLLLHSLGCSASHHKHTHWGRG